VVAMMVLITLLKPLKEPRILPVREGVETKTAPEVKIVGALVLGAVAVFYVIFW